MQNFKEQSIHLISDSNDIEMASGSCASKFETLPPGIRDVEGTSLTHHVATTCTAHTKRVGEKRMLKSLLALKLNAIKLKARAVGHFVQRKIRQLGSLNCIANNWKLDFNKFGQ